MGQTAVMNLKLMVDTKANKVVFAEASKDFVDFVFHILSLPLATVVGLLNNKGMDGCLQSIYTSFMSLPDAYLEPTINKYSVFKPSMDVIVPSLLLNETSINTVFYKCPTHNVIGRTFGQSCLEYGCSKPIGNVDGSYLKYVNANAKAGFVKAVVPFMVMDDLEVKPMTISILKNHVTGSNLEEKVVKVGFKEGLEMLKASLETKAVLTTVFLKKDD